MSIQALLPVPLIRKPLPTPLVMPMKKSKSKSRGLRRKFTKEEDSHLKALVHEFGEESWTKIAERMQNRSSRQCKERYKNYLADTVKNGPWTQDEEDLLEKMYMKYSSRWTMISTFFPERSDANVKNHWAFMQVQRQKALKNITVPNTTDESENISSDEIFSPIISDFAENEKYSVFDDFDFYLNNTIKTELDLLFVDRCEFSNDSDQKDLFELF